MKMQMNFHSNGDVYTNLNCRDIDYIGRIDSEGDWRPDEDCVATEDAVRAALLAEMDAETEWQWTDAQRRFAGIA